MGQTILMGEYGYLKKPTSLGNMFVFLIIPIERWEAIIVKTIKVFVTKIAN